MLKNSNLVMLFLILTSLNSIFSGNTGNTFPKSIEVEVKFIKDNQIIRKLILSSYSHGDIKFAPQEFENKFFKILLNNITSDKLNFALILFSKIDRKASKAKDARTAALGQEICKFKEQIKLGKEYICKLYSKKSSGNISFQFNVNIR